MTPDGRRPPLPPVAFFVATALALALTAGFGLGLWLLLARTEGVALFGLSWLALVQVHGATQLFGFAGLFVMGVGFHLLPRFRGAPPPGRARLALCYVPTLAGIGCRLVAQPAAELPLRALVLGAGSALLVAGTLAFAVSALGILRGGTNPHRRDEVVIGLGIAALPLAALVTALGSGGAPLVVEATADDRAVWATLLLSLATTIFGVWARIAPGFVATPPAPPARLLAGAALWLIGAAGLTAGAPWGALPLAAGLAVVTWALGVYGATIARQPLAGHARLTQLAVRSAFAWALVGAALLVVEALAPGADASFLRLSAARHALALGFVTLMIYGVGARALPNFLGADLASPRLHRTVLVLANLGVALRVLPQAAALGGPLAEGIEAASGILAYAAVVGFAVNVARTARGRRPGPPLGARAVPIRLRDGG